MKTERIRGKRKEILIFFLPNLFTSANLFFGFFSVLNSFQGRWVTAAYAIFVAAFADGLDGRVARLTKAQSAFGEEYDSLADLISFGMAPAMLLYFWALQPFGRLGWIAAFAFLLCAALRLARFNVLKQSVEKRYFQGLPSPFAAGAVASAVLFYREMGLVTDFREPFTVVLAFVLAVSMISTLRYRSFKDLKFKSQKTFAWMLLIAVSIIVVSPKPELTLFPVAMMYVLWGPLGELSRLVWKRFFRIIPKSKK